MTSVQDMENIKEERDLAQKYLDIVGSMVVVLDSSKKVTVINKKGCEVLGYNEDEVVGKDWFENFLPERLRESIGRVAEKLFVGEEELVDKFENVVLTKSGEERLIAWSNSVLKDKSGKITHLLSSGEDITDRKKSEEDLKNKVEELEKFNELTTNRELKMISLKKRIKELEVKLEECK